MPIDYSKYPSNWKAEIVPRILNRASHCCEFCGVANYAIVWIFPIQVKVAGKYSVRRIWIASDTDKERLRINFTRSGDIKQIRVVLTVAHLDYDSENHNVKDDRLAALCQQCHLVYDTKEKQRRILAKSSEVQLPLEELK